MYHISPVEIKHFPKAGALKENSKQKAKISALLAGTSEKGTLEPEVEAR
jgi:hypothetical protein